jgi:bis(5'-nucleosyl)-tetraphosphatase (symmetrical)
MFVSRWCCYSTFARGIAYCASLGLISALQLVSQCDDGPVQREKLLSPRAADAKLRHSRHATLRIPNNETPRPNILVVGDVHGCYEEMLQLYDTAGSPEIVILVGDLVNKGPHSAKVVHHVRTTPGWFAVRGNHDIGAVQAATGDPEQAQKKKYEWLFRETGKPVLSNDDVQWLADLPFTIRILAADMGQESDIIIVHAGFVPGIALEDQTDATMVTLRTVSRAADGQYQYDSAGKGVPWASVWNGPDFVIFGHDAKQGLQQEPQALGLDTGACYGKKLSGILLPSKTIYQVNSLQTYCRIDGEDS